MSFPFLVDIDNVCVDWLSGFHQWMEATNGHVPNEIDSYLLADHYPYLPDLIPYVVKYSNSTAYRELPLMPGCAAGIASIRETFPKSLIVAVTCCGTGATAIRSRRHQLRDLPFDAIIPLPITAGKGSVYRQFQPGYVIEDSVEQMEAALRYGHRVCCWDQPWNRSYNPDNSNFARITDWTWL